MRRNFFLRAAAAFAGVGLILAAGAPAQQAQQREQQGQRQQGQQRQQNTGTLLPAGARLTSGTDRDGITTTLAEVTEAAVTLGGFNDLVERLVDADRNRIGDYTDREFEVLNGRIRQIQRLWARRYGTRFDADGEVVFAEPFNGLRIVSGVIRDPYQFARNWPLDPTPRQPGGIQRDVELRAYGVLDDESWNDANANGATGNDYESDDLDGLDEGVYDDEFGYADGYPYGYGYGYGGYYGFGVYPGMYDGVGTDANGTRIDDAEQKNIESGREVAVVRLPARGNLPALNVSMIDEAYGWKIDVPETVSGPQLRRVLLNHLTYLGENPRLWPAEPDEAARLFAHHVVMATYGLGVPAYQDGQSSASARRQ